MIAYVVSVHKHFSPQKSKLRIVGFNAWLVTGAVVESKLRLAELAINLGPHAPGKVVTDTIRLVD